MPYHKILERQISKFSGGELFQAISTTYTHSDEDRALLERSLELSSKELEEVNKQLQSERDQIEIQVQQRTQELKAERNKISVTLAGIVDAVIVVDLNHNIIIFNKAAEKLTGFQLSEVLGKPINQIIKIFDKNTELPPSTFCPVSSDDFEGIVYSKEDLILTGLKGKQTYINLLASQIEEGRDVNLGCILTLYDISKEKQLEEMRLDFVSMAVHELRTPLTSIKGYLYIYLRDYKKALDSKQNSLLSRINISTQRLVSLVENLLNVTRIEKGTLTLNLQPIDWVQNINEVIAEIIDQAQDKNIELNFTEPTKPLSHILADKFRINEVLANLLANAVNYTRQEGKVTVWIEEKGSEVITHITDNGPGIPKEAIPHLFTKFFRVSGSLEQGSKGTGLGLYIAKSIVEIHKGKIWAESEFGKGSTFSFSLPIV
ncbi:PAS domain-containing protein [Candidatus Daviesbacteria bacterium]|nr:PAS domain-containing protein [Candidatus Daviesbacteria bacterium]